jgi:hypothetical protein
MSREQERVSVSAIIKSSDYRKTANWSSATVSAPPLPLPPALAELFSAGLRPSNYRHIAELLFQFSGFIFNPK